MVAHQVTHSPVWDIVVQPLFTGTVWLCGPVCRMDNTGFHGRRGKFTGTVWLCGPVCMMDNTGFHGRSGNYFTIIASFNVLIKNVDMSI